VQQLKDAGNWNVLVLYASKWTRDQPDNAVAWKELSIGYANLRQFQRRGRRGHESRGAVPYRGAALAQRRAPERDAERLPEAESAFDRALAISADDADALCGAALVALRSGGKTPMRLRGG
jgi:tetratricopeptide (TPR) repeat protein